MINDAIRQVEDFVIGYATNERPSDIHHHLGRVARCLGMGSITGAERRELERCQAELEALRRRL